MDIALDLSGRRVLVVGDARPARRVLARYRLGGAVICHLPRSPGAISATSTVVELPGSGAEWDDLLSEIDLVVIVDASVQTDRDLVDACSRSGVWVSREPAAPTSTLGHVTLVGGGPGDAELITVGALSALRDADIVFFDRLSPHDRLAEWSPGAMLVNVGKSPGHHAVSQSEIERMIVDAALAGNSVVRLKGGDPFVFGRGGEEVIACREAGVPVSVISGVSSAIAAPAAVGIPVTHREVSRLFTVLSGHAPLSDDELSHLVGLGGTLVVLMGIGTLPHLSAGLARHGMRSSMPVAIIERAFSSTRRTTVADIGTAVAAATQAGARSPAVLVIGDVVRLAHGEDAAATELLEHAARLGG